ncbi:protein peste-like isoform X2 [Bacillus rossius redtenbacheri]
MWSRKTVRSLLLVSVGLTLALAGGISSFYWANIFDYILTKELYLSPSSTSYSVWKDTPVPISIKFYFFNWTNPEDLEIEGSKPRLVQMGPYVFNELEEKVNVTWNDNHTISYQQRRTWFFDAERSNGSLADNITTLNVVAVTASYVAREWNYFVQKSISVAFSTMRQKVHITKTVGELLFQGYSDPVIAMGSSFPLPPGVRIPYDKFGWFYQRNGSTTYDGVYNMATGQDDIRRLGDLLQWNHRNRTDFYPGSCGEVRGSAGQLWPPYRQRKDSVHMFSTDLCRSIWFDYLDDVEVSGLKAYRYSGGAGIVDNGTLDSANDCYCGGRCVPSGVLNVSSCRFGSPAFVSYPHFHLADPYYLRQVDGMQPEPDKHRFDISIEPTTGIPLDVAARFQINILLETRPYVTLFRRVPTIFFPVMWFEQRAAITPDMASQMKLLLQLPSFGLATSLALLTVGTVLVAATLLCCVCSGRHGAAGDHALDKKLAGEAVFEGHVISPLLGKKARPEVSQIGRT